MSLELLSNRLQILAIFTTELPDEDQNLYYQLGKDLDQFTVFRALPLEIRNMIWRQALPNWKARKIDICASYSETTWSGKKIPARRAMPVTMVSLFTVSHLLYHKTHLQMSLFASSIPVSAGC